MMTLHPNAPLPGEKKTTHDQANDADLASLILTSIVIQLLYPNPHQLPTKIYYPPFFLNK